MSANKAKGTKWEVQVREFFKANGINAYRPAQEGYKDTGDIHGVDPFTVQAKDWRDWQSAIREGLDGAQVQKVNAGNEFGVAVVKRARRPASEAYVVMRLADFTTIVNRLREAS